MIQMLYHVNFRLDDLKRSTLNHVLEFGQASLSCPVAHDGC